MIAPRIVLLFTLLFLSFGSFSQATIGFTFSPTLSTNRVEYDREVNGTDVTSNDTGLRFKGGPILDVQLTENYYASTGILFNSKRVGITVEDASNPGSSVEEVYNLQYVSLPATMKLFTNEVSLDTKIYFQFGTTLDFLVSNKEKDEVNRYISGFRIFDTSLLFAIGAEYKAGVNTSLFGGFSYSRGLINSVNETAFLDNKLTVKNDLLNLVLGIKF